MFNEHGEPNTTTNQIADEVDISPGNLHYHFHKKSEIVEALLAEFQADARRILNPPAEDHATIADFLAFVHILLEVLAAYRFLFRDMATLADAYPKTQHALRGFSNALTAAMQLYVEAMRRDEQLLISDKDVPLLCRSLVVVALFSERYDEVCDKFSTADRAALKAASGILGLLMPYAAADTRPMFAELISFHD